MTFGRIQKCIPNLETPRTIMYNTGEGSKIDHVVVGIHSGLLIKFKRIKRLKSRRRPIN